MLQTLPPLPKPVEEIEEETYNDEVTPETITKMNEVVDDQEFDDYETVAGPAW